MVRLPATAEESSDSAPSPQTTCWGGSRQAGRAGRRETRNGGKMRSNGVDSVQACGPWGCGATGRIAGNLRVGGWMGVEVTLKRQS